MRIDGPSLMIGGYRGPVPIVTAAEESVRHATRSRWFTRCHRIGIAQLGGARRRHGATRAGAELERNLPGRRRRHRVRGSHRPLAKAGDNFNANGVTVGAGAEYKFTDNLSLRGEYRFTNLENSSGHRFFDFEVDDHFARSAADVNIQQVLFTLNWRFGGFGLPF
jgi:opacity protein-like surface antigen